MNLQSHISRKVLPELHEHLEQAKQIAEEAGEDGRPPLVRVQRWRFTAQNLLRRTLTDEHPLLVRFDQHCYRGLLDRHRFRTAVEIFEAAVAAASEHGLALQFGCIRLLLESVQHAPDESPEYMLRGGLWHAVGLLAALAGVRGPGEHPSNQVIGSRLLECGVLKDDLLASLNSQEPDLIRRAAGELIELMGAEGEGVEEREPPGGVP